VVAIVCEVTDVLTERGYRVLVQDYDIPLGASFIEAMHEAVKNSRDLIILYTRDYEQSPYTRKSSRASRQNGRRARRSATSSSCAARTCRYAGCSPTTSIKTSWASMIHRNASVAS
jgi:hypothetical protein